MTLVTAQFHYNLPLTVLGMLSLITPLYSAVQKTDDGALRVESTSVHDRDERSARHRSDRGPASPTLICDRAGVGNQPWRRRVGSQTIQGGFCEKVEFSKFSHSTWGVVRAERLMGTERYCRNYFDPVGDRRLLGTSLQPPLRQPPLYHSNIPSLNSAWGPAFERLGSTTLVQLAMHLVIPAVSEYYIISWKLFQTDLGKYILKSKMLLLCYKVITWIKLILII